jgi:hypothetical protein
VPSWAGCRPISAPCEIHIVGEEEPVWPARRTSQQRWLAKGKFWHGFQVTELFRKKTASLIPKIKNPDTLFSTKQIFFKTFFKNNLYYNNLDRMGRLCLSGPPARVVSPSLFSKKRTKRPITSFETKINRYFSGLIFYQNYVSIYLFSPSNPSAPFFLVDVLCGFRTLFGAGGGAGRQPFVGRPQL